MRHRRGLRTRPASARLLGAALPQPRSQLATQPPLAPSDHGRHEDVLHCGRRSLLGAAQPERRAQVRAMGDQRQRGRHADEILPFEVAIDRVLLDVVSLDAEIGQTFECAAVEHGKNQADGLVERHQPLSLPILDPKHRRGLAQIGDQSRKNIPLAGQRVEIASNRGQPRAMINGAGCRRAGRGLRCAALEGVDRWLEPEQTGRSRCSRAGLRSYWSGRNWR